MALAAATVCVCLGATAKAQDAVWVGATSEISTPSNWIPSVPTGVATFDAFGVGTVDINGSITLGEIRFATSAISHQLWVNTGTLTLNGAGTTSTAANSQQFFVYGGLTFSNNATITSSGTGLVFIYNYGVTAFTDSSSAGNAHIFNYGTGSNGIFFFGTSATTFASAGDSNFNNSGDVYFFGYSSAGTSYITNNNGASIQFNGNSTAASADIANSGSISFAFNATAGDASINNFNTLSFNGNSNAGTSEITNQTGAFLDFFQFASAADATLNNQGGAITFSDNSTAGSATITNTSFGSLTFNNSATAGNATIFNSADITFNNTSTAGNATINNNGNLNFNNSSTAGFATITNYCCLAFNDSSTAGNANITNNGTIEFYGVSSTVFATAGNATITNNVFGTINFNGFSTAGNATITNNDTINFYDDSKAGTSSITNNYQLTFNDRSTAQNATIINNGGLGFGNASTAGNATIINNLLLFFIDSSTAGDSTITVNNGADLIFIDNSTGGNARLIVNAGGVVDFTGTAGPNNDGIVSVGSLEGTGLVGIGNVTLYVGTNNLSTTFNGVIADDCGCGFVTPGNLVKTGTGTLTLNGANTYTGFTEVQQGTLIINGSITSNTTVYAGAIIGGSGTIFGDLTINSNGILSPGNSVGTMTINGNATFNNVIYRVEVEPGISDRVNVSGTATINGGTVQVTGANVSYGVNQTTVIVNAASGVTGTFANVTDNLAFYDASLSYDANNVYLTLTRNQNNFTGFGTTPNQTGVGGALDRAALDAALLLRLYGYTPEQVSAVLNLLSGEMYASMMGAFIDESRLFRNAILSRLRTTSFAGFSGPLGYLSEDNEQAVAYAPTRRSNAFNSLRPVDRGIEYWAQAFGSWAKYDSDSNAATARRATGGFVVGADQSVAEGIRAGLSAGYSNTQTRVPDRASKGEGDTFHLAAYLSKLDGRWTYRTGAAVSLHNVNSERQVLGDTLRADYFAMTGQLFGEIGYGIVAGQFAVEPFANMALVHHYTNGFSETGGLAALTTNGFDQTNGFSTLGMRFATRYQLENNWVLIPRAMIGWQHAYGDLTPLATLTFQNTGTGMTIAGTPLARDMLLTEAGFDIRISPFQTLGFFYAATIASDTSEQSVRGKYQWRF